MKRTPLAFAALVPFAAIAAGSDSQKNEVTVDQQELESTVPVTEITGSDVLTRDGRDVGNVQDVILDQDGSVMSLIVERENTDDSAMQASSTDTQGMDRAAETSAENANEQDGTKAAGKGSEYAKLDWNNVSYDQQENAIRLSGSRNSLQPVQYDEDQQLRGRGHVRSSALVGMDVNLSDKESYGEVEDVMIDTGDGKARALVVDGGGFFSNKTYALPANLNSVSEREEQVTLDCSSQELENAEEFDIDAVTDAI